ncbi:MAG: hypothetical protein QOF80_2596 [Verrucomicrobiota bacterium]
MRSFRLLRWVACVALSFSMAANGQSTASSPVNGASPAKAEITPPKEDHTKQDKAITAGKTANETRNAVPGSSPKAAKMVRIRKGDELSVEVSDLKERLEKQPAVGKTIRLFLDCKPIEGLTPVPCLGEKKVLFKLDREAIEQITTRTKIVSVGISFADQQNAELVMPEKVQLVVVADDYRLLIVIGLVLLMAIVLFVYGRYTNLLRDGQPPGPLVPAPPADPAPGPGSQSFPLLQFLPGLHRVMPKPGYLAQYSLAKVQMAWWLFFVVVAFLFIWLAVGDFNTLTTSTLVLLGISAATTVASKMVSSSKQATAQDLTAKKDALQQQVNRLQLTAVAPHTEAQKQELDFKTTQITQANTQLNQMMLPPDEATSQGFLTDIMSDENGISIHRFQMVVWTVVLTLIFVHEVYATLSMPQFSDTLLTLMGISAGTYVALKIPEKKSVVAS